MKKNAELDALNALALDDLSSNESSCLGMGLGNLNHPPRVMTRIETGMTILDDCSLVSLQDSCCLSCTKSTIVQSKSKVVVLYCSALHRDLELAIERCTSWELGSKPSQH